MSDDELTQLPLQQQDVEMKEPADPNQNLVEDDAPPPEPAAAEPAKDAEEEEEDEEYPKGTWVLFTRDGQKRIAKVLEDKCCFVEKADGTKKWMMKVQPFHMGKPCDMIRMARRRVIQVLKVGKKGEPIVPDSSSSSEGEGEEEKKEEKAEKKKVEKKEKKLSKTIAKRQPAAAKTEKKKAKKEEVDHEDECTTARVWAMKQLSLHKYKDADQLSAMAPPDVIQTGSSDSQLKAHKKLSKEMGYEDVTFHGCAVAYASTVGGDCAIQRNLFASLLILMLTTENDDRYSDLKSLKKHVKDSAWYNVQGHLCRDVLKLDFNVKDELEYVQRLYKVLNTHLDPRATPYASKEEAEAVAAADVD